MRIKYYLRGIGCGIIFSVIIMSVAVGNKEKVKISDAEIIQRAKQLGMVDADEMKDKNNLESESESVTENDVEDNSSIPSEKETESVKETSNSKKDKDTEIEQDIDNKKEDDEGSVNSLTNQKPVSETNKSDKENKKDSEDNTISEDNKNANDEIEYVSFTIKSGQVCRQIAENMQKQGIIDDAEAFREYMASKGLASNIRCGTLKLPKGATYEKLAECLTAKE